VNSAIQTSSELVKHYFNEWDNLSSIEKAIEKIANSDKYKQYCIAIKYGNHWRPSK